MPIGKLMLRLLPMWFAVPIASAATGLVDDPMGLLTVPVLTLLWMLVPILSLIWSVQFATKRAWRHVLVTIALPAATALTVALSYLNVPVEYFQFGYPADVVHFMRLKSSYDRQIAALPSNKSRIMLFDWGGWPNAWDEVVYDDTDQVSLLASLRSKAWVSLSRRSHDFDELCGADHLWGHYYIAHFGC